MLGDIGDLAVLLIFHRGQRIRVFSVTEIVPTANQGVDPRAVVLDDCATVFEMKSEIGAEETVDGAGAILEIEKVFVGQDSSVLISTEK